MKTLLACKTDEERLDLESKVLAAAFKQSFESGDSSGAALAHKGLCHILQVRLFGGGGGPLVKMPPAQPQESVTAPSPAPLPTPSGQTPSAQTPVVAPDTATSTTEPAASAEPAPASASASASASLDAYADAASDDAAAIAQAAVAMEAALAAEAAALSAAESKPEKPAGGPATYLDFSTDEPVDAPTAAKPAPNRTGSTYYELLGVNNLSSFEEIHTAFIRGAKALLRNRYKNLEWSTREVIQFREQLRALCVAHDILRDPVTRTDYDLRSMGMRATPGQIETPEDARTTQPTNRTRLMIGELLECAKILEPAELEIALDMHRAEPGMQFGQFLVKAGFLNQEELDSAILGQRLISAGKITVRQFQSAMYEMRENDVAFFDTLVIEGWIQPKDIFDDQSEFWKIAQGLPVESEAPSNTPQDDTIPMERYSESPPTQDAQIAFSESFEGALGHGQPEPLTPSFATTDSNLNSALALPGDLGGGEGFITEPTVEKLSESEIESMLEKAAAAEEKQKRVATVTEGDVSSTYVSRKRKADFGEGWTEKDAAAETQTIDVNEFRARLNKSADDAD